MRAFTKHLVAGLFMVGLIGGLAAHTHESAGDTEAIAALMNGLWDTPDNRLAVEPVVLSGDYGLAGWTQAGRGGRALLHKQHGHWKIIVCGGDNLKDTVLLMSAGLDRHTAQSLADGIKQAEASLAQDKLKLLASFEGLVKLDSAQSRSEHAPHQHSH
jgi:hypothetical protein